jgi:hypothetical protein
MQMQLVCMGDLDPLGRTPNSTRGTYSKPRLPRSLSVTSAGEAAGGDGRGVGGRVATLKRESGQNLHMFVWFGLILAAPVPFEVCSLKLNGLIQLWREIGEGSAING